MRTTERGSPLASESSSTCSWDVSAGRAPLSGSPGHRATGVSDWPYLDEHVAPQCFVSKTVSAARPDPVGS